VAIVYGAITTIRQTNLKRLIAYSSISHMGLVTIAIFTHSIEGVISSIIIMFAHGLISSGLFIAVTSIYERSHTMIIRIIKISTITPILCSIFFLLSLANMATPCSLNF
jgi:NADH:ubiquinone oxidoreductase subunit 4 (subunit M)